MSSYVVAVYESGTAQQDLEGEPCVLGHHASIDKARLDAFLARELDQVDADLLNLLAVVRYGDRLRTRRVTQSWGREFLVRMPVADPQRWSSERVRDALGSCLMRLTGDRWQFAFRARKEPDPLMVQRDLFGQTRRGGVVLPYSGGLDSYAALELLLGEAAADTPKPILLTAGVSARVDALISETTGGADCHSLVMPIRSKAVEHGESSGRTRTFLFFTLAALAAKMAEAEAVVVPENGQGTLGPVLVPFGREHPLMTSHPRFTRLLREFLRALWDQEPPQYRHPWVFTTKGQMLSAARAAGRARGWEKTLSCGRHTARAKGKGAPEHCGLCANCVLRRVSLHVAGLSNIAKPSEDYLWSVTADSMEGGLVDGMREGTERDRGYGVNGVMNHVSLADVRTSAAGPTLRRKIEDVAWGLGVSTEEATAGISRLVATHRGEWKQCLDALPPTSWVREITRRAG